MFDGVGANGCNNSQQSIDVQCILGWIRPIRLRQLTNSAAILFSIRTVRLFENIWPSPLKKKQGKDWSVDLETRGEGLIQLHHATADDRRHTEENTKT